MSELFTVRLSTGHEQRYTLDELDTAYKGGFIDEKTLVKPSTSARWMTLGELAGIEEEASPPSIAPMAIDAGYDIPVDLAPSTAALDSSEIPAELRPRKTGRIFAIGIAVVAVIGLGVAATRGASTIASAAGSLKAKIVTSSADAPKAAAAMTPAAPEKPTERQGTTTTTPAPASAPTTVTTDKLPDAAPSVKGNVPTMSAASLPDAKEKKKSAPGKTRTRK